MKKLTIIKQKILSFRRQIIAVLIFMFLLTACYEFDFVNQPYIADPNSFFDVQISVIESGASQGEFYFGVLLPTGWTTSDSIEYISITTNDTGVVIYSESLTLEMTAIDPPPDNYHWWVGLSYFSNEIPVPGANETLISDFKIYTAGQTGNFFLDYMLGDQSNGLNYKRSNDHLIFVGEPVGCLPEGINFTTQEQIDNFQTNYPDCNKIEGNVMISGNNITDLNGLIVLKLIELELFFSGTNALPNLDGLQGLTSVGNLRFINNLSLTSLNGLTNLTYAGGWIEFTNNTSLISLTGIENIDQNSFEELYIRENTNLSICEIKSICDYLSNAGGYVEIYNNAPGCNNQQEVEDACTSCLSNGITFASQAQIDDFQINYPACLKIAGDVVIRGDDITNLNGLNVLTAIWGDLLIGDNNNGNPVLTNLTGLDNVTSIGGHLIILNNTELYNLTGLDNMTSIGGGIWINNNHALISLAGLDNIDAGSINDLYIYGNPSLFTCEVQSVCDFLASPNGTISIHDNAPGCNSQEEVEDACWTKVDESVDIGYDIQIFPNPAKNEIFISAKDGLIINGVNIYNQIGQRVIHKKGKTNTVDVSMLRQGMYIIEIEIDNGKYRNKLIIE